MHRAERAMNPVAMTIINPRKEYWPSQGSNQEPPILKSYTLPTELWGLGTVVRGKAFKRNLLTLSQKTNARPFQIQRLCRRHS